jgi:hypothetical protein
MKNGFPAPNKELAKTKNNHLTGKAPYKFESGLLQRGVLCEPDAQYRSPRLCCGLPGDRRCFFFVSVILTMPSCEITKRLISLLGTGVALNPSM